MDLGTLHLLVNLHHLHSGSVDLHQIIQQNLRAQKVPHSQGKEDPPVKSLPMSPATVRGLKRWIAAKKTENQGSKKSQKSETKPSIIKSLLPVLVEPKRASSPLSSLDRQSNCSSAWTDLLSKNQSSNVIQSISAPLHFHSNISSCSLSESVISNKKGKQIENMAHFHGIYDSPSSSLSQKEEFTDCEFQSKHGIHPDMETQWNKSFEPKTWGENVMSENQSKHISEKYEFSPKHSRHKERYAQSTSGQDLDAQDCLIHSKDSSFSNNERYASREQPHSYVSVTHDRQTLHKTDFGTHSTSLIDLNSFSEMEHSNGTWNSKSSPLNRNEENHRHRQMENLEYHPNFAKKPRINDAECSGGKVQFTFHENLPQDTIAFSHGLSGDNKTKHVSSTGDTETCMHDSGVDTSMSEREFPKEENPVLVTAKTCRWKLPTWLMKRRRNNESVGHNVNSPDFLINHESLQYLPGDRKLSIDTSEMESIIRVLMKAQKCFNETPFCDNKEELREKQSLFLQNSQKCPGENSAHINKDLQNTDRQLVDTLCNFVEAKVMEMVKFAKRIPGFSCLDVQDQARLLKSSKSESFMIGGMPIIDPSRRVFSGTNGQHFKLEEFEKVLPKKFFDGKVQIAKKLEKLQLSERETAILRALVITFPDRCPLGDKGKVQHIHNVILECFLNEVEENYVDVDEHVRSVFDLLNFMIDVAPDSIFLHRMFEQHGTYASNQLIAEYIEPCSMKTSFNAPQ